MTLNEHFSIAVELNDVILVKSLIADGADIHARREEALYNAIVAGQTEIVKILLAAGANVTADNFLRCATACHHNDIADVLRSVNSR